MADIKIKKAVIREDLLSITNDYRKAIILNQFIYWSERVSDADKFIKKENEIAKNNGEEERELFYGWIYKTAEELADEVMLGLSASQIRRYISDLVNMGYISKRNNPKYRWDRTLQYRVNLVNIAKDLKKNGYPLSDYKIEIPENEKTITHECVINNEPMKNQTQASDEAIPKSTNIDYLNKDYKSNSTECNSLNREQCNSFLPKDKKVKEFKPISEYSQSDWEVAEERMINRAGKIAYDWTNDKTLKENTEAFFKYFLDKHGECTGEYHYPLTDKVLSRVVDNLTKETDIERDGYTDTYYAAISDMDDNTDYKMLVDEYFNTKFSTQCDYSLVHFSSEKVLINIMNHACKSSWCESKEW